MSAEPARPSDDAVLTAALQALRETVLPRLDRAHARTTVVQLVGLLEYLRDRGPDRSQARAAELASALDGLAGNPIVTAWWPGEPFVAAGRALAAAVGRTDVDAAQVRDVLRPLLVSHLDAELVETMPLVAAFRGVLRDG